MDRRFVSCVTCVVCFGTQDNHCDGFTAARSTQSEILAIFVACEVGGVVQGDEGPVDGVAQVIGCHGVTVSHQEEGQEEEVEKQGEVKGEVEEELKEHCTWMACGWNDKTSASGLSHVV